jgi:isopentenyl-diphosphate delta-isomerase type 1
VASGHEAAPDGAAHLAAGYRQCARITRDHGTTYYWGARMLRRRSRHHVYAVYTLARLADDIVDSAGPTPGPETAAELEAFEQRFWTALEAGTDADPVMAAIVTSVREARIDPECFERFFGAMRMDLTVSTYETWADLLGYMEGSAAVIGEMMLPVLQPGPGAKEAARSLGLAFQLTNFLRDVGEDLERGRVYVPQEDLRRFGADPHARAVDDGWRALMAFEIERNRRLYREADEGIPLLGGAARRCVATARVLYARILELIEDADYDVFSDRLRVPTRDKAVLAGRMLTHPRPMTLVRRDRAATPPSTAAWNDAPVVLLTEDGESAGMAAKSAVHHDDTPLHLAFSCYVLDDAGRVLVTTRAADKPSFPSVVTNSFCGHPLPGEPLVAAVRRRAETELGVRIERPRLVLPRFRYRAVSNSGLVEHELCPVYAARAESTDLHLDPSEVSSGEWVPWAEFSADILSGRRQVSPWCAEQVAELVRLGPDPHTWPEAADADLPPAARTLTEVS